MIRFFSLPRMILQIDGCLDVINRILINLSDDDLLNLCRASPKLEHLFNLPSSHWRRRLERYNPRLVERFLKHTGHVVDSLHSYCQFITELDKCITCKSRPSLSVDYTRNGFETLLLRFQLTDF